MSYKYLDLFAGAGGLSEGFMRAGFKPLAHVEVDRAACFTLQTRLSYKWLQDNDKEHIYNSYLAGEINRKELYSNIPKNILDSVLNYEISQQNLDEIFDILDSKLEKGHLDLIVGGPPCQAYSLVGRAVDKNKMIGDKRNYLYTLYAEFLKKYKPKYFVFENVLGILSARDTDGELHFDKMQKKFLECGYSLEYKILNAKDYGVLQNRKRVILIGKKGNAKEFYPEITRIKNEYTVGEIFKDLPFLKAGEGSERPTVTNEYTGKYLYESKIKSQNFNTVTFHCARPNNEQDLKIYKLVVEAWNEKHERISYKNLPRKLQSHNNVKAFLDRFKVVACNLPYSQTVLAHISKDGHYFIHPDVEQNRSLTPREAARLQTFPDDYYFESVSGIPARTTAYKQIGNAVPVLLAEKIAKSLLEVW